GSEAARYTLPVLLQELFRIATGMGNGKERETKFHGLLDDDLCVLSARDRHHDVDIADHGQTPTQWRSSGHHPQGDAVLLAHPDPRVWAGLGDPCLVALLQGDAILLGIPPSSLQRAHVSRDASRPSLPTPNPAGDNDRGHRVEDLAGGG